MLHGGPRFILAESSSSLGRLLLALRASWRRKTLKLLAFTTSFFAVFRYEVYLPTHLLTNTALYCTMTTLKSLSRLNDHQEDEICSYLACLHCQGTCECTWCTFIAIVWAFSTNVDTSRVLVRWIVTVPFVDSTYVRTWSKRVGRGTDLAMQSIES
jgi:hypothetical protein